MQYVVSFARILNDAFSSIIYQLISYKTVIAPDNDEIVDSILKDEKGKLEFQKEVDALIHSKDSSKEIIINDRKFTISI